MEAENTGVFDRNLSYSTGARSADWKLDLKF